MVLSHPSSSSEDDPFQVDDAAGLDADDADDASSAYDVEIGDARGHAVRRRIHRVGVKPHLDLGGRAAGAPNDRNAPKPSVLGLVAMLWRLLAALLRWLGPPDHPHIIAIIQAPSRMYCARCGTVRVSRWCPCCGANVDRQYRKLVRQLARYAVDGTADHRRTLEQALGREIQRQVEQVRRDHRQLLAEQLQKLERHYVLEIARHRKTIRALLEGRIPQLPADTGPSGAPDTLPLSE